MRVTFEEFSPTHDFFDYRRAFEISEMLRKRKLLEKKQVDTSVP